MKVLFFEFCVYSFFIFKLFSIAFWNEFKNSITQIQKQQYYSNIFKTVLYKIMKSSKTLEMILNYSSKREMFIYERIIILVAIIN